MAAGTAAGLVRIRSITRQMAASDPKSLAATVGTHPRLSTEDGQETVTYLTGENDEEAGPITQKLLKQLKDIQLGRAAEDFGWGFAVSAEDGQKVLANSGAVGA